MTNISESTLRHKYFTSQQLERENTSRWGHNYLQVTHSSYKQIFRCHT